MVISQTAAQENSASSGNQQDADDYEEQEPSITDVSIRLLNLPILHRNIPSRNEIDQLIVS